MKSRYLILSLLAILLLVACQHAEPATETTGVDTEPLDVVEAFYGWYTQYPPGDARRAELVPAENEALSPALRGSIVEMGQAMHADPIVCAQDMPQGFTFEQRMVEGNQAEVMVQTLWNPGTEFEMTHDIMVSLVKQDDAWQIERIDCPAPPA